MTHNYTTIARTVLLFLLSGTLITGCGSADQQKDAGFSITDSATAANMSAIPGRNENNSGQATDSAAVVEVAIFEVKDNPGGSGYGYDIVINGKKTVHQPMIPAVQGNKCFITEQEARAVGELAASRMRKTGDLPTINVKDLDSLKITYR